MSRKASPTLTESELEIMQVVWNLGRATVREVHEALASSRRVAYTTVMTMMGILADKGHLVRSKDGRAFVYEPAEAKSRVISGMVDEFLERVFDGSTRPLLVSLIKDRRLSKGDLEEVRQMIEESDE